MNPFVKLAGGTVDEIWSNVLTNSVRKLPQVTRGSRKSMPVAFIGGGPSLSGFVDTLRTWEGKIWCVNGQHDWLLDHDMRPDVCVFTDSAPSMVDYATRPDKRCSFYVASKCNPALFDALKHRKVTIAHMVSSQLPGSGIGPDVLVPILGGTTAYTRMLYIAYIRGYRDFHLFGCDSSFADGVQNVGYGSHHTNLETVDWAGKSWPTTREFHRQADELARMSAAACDGVRITTHGEGLAQAMIADPPRQGLPGPFWHGSVGYAAAGRRARRAADDTGVRMSQ